MEYFIKAEPKQMYGFDVDQKAVDICREKFLKHENISLQQTDGKTIPLDGSQIDVVISLETIEHIDDDASFIHEVARILKPGGLFIVSTPNRLCTNPGSSIKDKPWNPFHVREYDPSEFTDLLSKDFEILERHGQNRVSPFAQRLLTFLGKKMGYMLAVRLNQFYKLRWFLIGKFANHEVVTCDVPEKFEYLVFVCRKRTRGNER